MLEPAARKTAEDKLILMQELARRRADDPLLSFVLLPKQRPFVDSVLGRKKWENWFVAANRSGKSDAGAFIGSTLARFGREDARYVGAAGSGVQVRDRSTSGWVVSLDFPSSRDTIQPKYFDNGFLARGSGHA